MGFEFWLDVLLAVLLALTIGYCFVLERKLRTLRQAQGRFESLLGDFSKATARAETSIDALREASTDICQDLDLKLQSAQSLRDELAVITESGNSIAGRLEESLLKRTSPAAEAGTRAEFTSTTGEVDRQSDSERELLQVLRHGN